LILFVAADVNEVARLGKDFPWVKPSGCPRCRQPLWWHGFVPAYFSCLTEAVFLRRLRCSCCRAVHRLKPQGYWPRFRSSLSDISASIHQRTTAGRWRRDQPSERQRQWWRRLRRMTAAILGIGFAGDGAAAFSTLVSRGWIPVSTSFQCGNPGTGPPPYRSVSLPRSSWG
jgi:hypothetical protein